ncbi:PIN domain-like protein, partial [Suillus subluteus]
DESLWMAESQHIPYRGHAQAGANAELKSLFRKLARLYCTPSEVIIVFDGPAKPAIKRGTHVIKTPPWLTEPFKHFAQTLGFAVHDAAGEAEAELAVLSHSGVIDAVITEDSNALVFGASHVFWSDPGCPDNIIVYSADNIQRHGEVMLSDGGLLLMALLCSGDYHDGLPGCGWKTARGLVQYGVGDNLLQEARAHSLTSSHEGLKDYICGWFCRLQEILVKDPLGHIGQRHPKFLNNVPDSFPDVSVVLAYVKPPTSVQPVSHDSHLFIHSKVLDLENLAYLCEFHFCWSRYTPPGPLQDYIWPGICIRVLLEVRPACVYYHAALF